MRRVVSLFLPTWATDRVRRRNGGLPQPEVPLITAMQDGNQRVIAAGRPPKKNAHSAT